MVSAQSWDVSWASLHSITDLGNDTYEVTGDDPFMHSNPLSVPVPRTRPFLYLEVHGLTQPLNFEFRWMDDESYFVTSQTLGFQMVPDGSGVAKQLVDLARTSDYDGITALRIDPGHGTNVTFKIQEINFLTSSEVPAEFIPQLVDLRCYTSKLHYQPGEKIEWKASLRAPNYPETRSSKILTINLEQADGTLVAQQIQHFGIQPGYTYRDLFGVFCPDELAALPSGSYWLRVKVQDQMTDLELQAEHQFGVQSSSDPLICETPFKYVKDFTFIRDQNNLWHVISITGDYYENHDWMPDGQERTFSHATSPDLKNWTWHEPILSINTKTFADGQGYFQDRGVWAPHVIFHDGLYYLFYTSTNSYVCQSISVATSSDLFEWTEYAHNPILNLEGKEWAIWGRTQWSDFRDPMVLADDDGRFYMYVTSSVSREGQHTGAVVVADSTDLFNWNNPRVALYTAPVPESPQVWKREGKYYMTTSALGGGTWVSDQPDQGWQALAFPRPPVQTWEKYVQTSPSYAEEVVTLPDGRQLMGSLTWRLWGNSLYFSEIQPSLQGHPEGYSTPLTFTENASSTWQAN